MSSLKKLHRDDQAQTMVFSIVSLVALLLMLGLPVNIGWTIQRRIKLQNAADAAAYGAALMQADTLSAVAWLNNTEAYFYTRLCEQVIDFNVYGVHALMYEWGKRNGGRQSDLPLVYHTAYREFTEKIRNGRDKYINQDGGRTLELWIKTLRMIKEEMLLALPKMMRHEAMRLAALNMGDIEHLEMAFFPEDAAHSAPVALKFHPNEANSFTEFAKWEDSSNPFVDRSLQLGRDLGVKYLDKGTTNFTNRLQSHPQSIPQSLVHGRKVWFDPYLGEPVPNIDGRLTTYAKTEDCWHPLDQADNYNFESGHGNLPSGHWHVIHTHIHYNCILIEGKPFPIPEIHQQGFGDGKCVCNIDKNAIIIALGVDVVLEPTVRKHHAYKYCPLCNTEFDRSPAGHGLYYPGIELYGREKKDTDDRLGLPHGQSSEVRVFIEDLLAYDSYLQFDKSKNYHKIIRENFTPDGDKDLTPTVWLRENGEHFFKWGITIALVYNQSAPMFGNTNVYETRDKMVAVSSAKAGMVGHQASELSSERLLCGLDRYDGVSPETMAQKYLRPRNVDDEMFNLMYTNWSARLIPVEKSAPDNYGPPIYHVFATRKLYKWNGSCSEASGTLAARLENGRSADWKKLQELVVY